MAKTVEKETVEQEPKVGSCLLWFFWGISLSFTTILSLVLLVLLAISVSLNVYLGWEMSGLEVSVSRQNQDQLVVEQAVPVIPTDILAAIPTNTPVILPPTPTSPPPPPEPTEPPPALEEASVDAQLATIVAIATEVASQAQSSSIPAVVLTPTPTPISPAVAIGGTPAASTDESVTGDSETRPAESPAEDASAAAAFEPPTTSSNSYKLIPIVGEREKRPFTEHGDLNLSLRGWEPVDVERALVDIKDAGVDPDAPNLGDVFGPNPDIVAVYNVHNWDWGCLCPGDLVDESEQAFLIGLKTTPGEPIFIPTRKQDIFGGNFFAMVLYADEDSLTLKYTPDGNVASGYTIHYEGLYVDPNLLKLFNESKGNELPGLTLETPVGVASDELIVAVRDNGKFFDARSLKDWWD